MPPSVMAPVMALKCCAVELAKLSVAPLVTVREVGAGAVVAPPEMVSEPACTLRAPVKAMFAPLRTRAEVALFWVRFVTLLPMSALMVTPAVP